MTDQDAGDVPEDPDADPDQLNPRTGAAARSGEPGPSASPSAAGQADDADPDADPDALNPRSGDQARPGH